MVQAFGGTLRTHLVDALDRSFEDWEFEGRKFTGISTPLVSVCGIAIRSKQHVAEVLDEAPNCRTCIKLTTSPLDRA